MSNPCFPPQKANACDVGNLADEARMMEMRWREAMTMAQEQQSAFQEWTQRAESAKKEWEEKQKQHRVAQQLQQQREKQWERAMKTATNDLEAIRKEYREISQKVDAVASKMSAAEECVQRLHECNPRESDVGGMDGSRGPPPRAPRQPQEMTSFPAAPYGGANPCPPPFMQSRPPFPS